MPSLCRNVKRCSPKPSKVNCDCKRAKKGAPACGHGWVWWIPTPAAIAFQGGHNVTWEVARTLRGFGLTKAEAFDLLVRIYNPRCSPPWREDEIRHKVEDAFSSRAKRIPDIRGRAS